MPSEASFRDLAEAYQFAAEVTAKVGVSKKWPSEASEGAAKLLAACLAATTKSGVDPSTPTAAAVFYRAVGEVFSPIKGPDGWSKLMEVWANAYKTAIAEAEEDRLNSGWTQASDYLSSVASDIVAISDGIRTVGQGAGGAIVETGKERPWVLLAVPGGLLLLFVAWKLGILKALLK